MTYIIFLLIIAIICSVAIYYYRYKSRQWHNIYEALRCRLLRGNIIRALQHMNDTCSTYNNEDEANRELTTCLNLLGHNAHYKFPLNDNRITDIFVDNSIIEGKLDPQWQDIDRLIGQVADYIETPYDIYIIIYGYASPEIIERIQKQIVARFPTRVSMIYLATPKRIRARELMARININAPYNDD